MTQSEAYQVEMRMNVQTWLLSQAVKKKLEVAKRKEHQQAASESPLPRGLHDALHSIFGSLISH